MSFLYECREGDVPDSAGVLLAQRWLGNVLLIEELSGLVLFLKLERVQAW